MGKFQPGQSGNPGGRPKDSHVRELARVRTKDAIHALVAIVKDSKASEMARVRAAEAILDRGWGKPIQATAFTDTEGNDRPLLAELSDLDRARRVAFLLGIGLRAAQLADEDKAVESAQVADQRAQFTHG